MDREQTRQKVLIIANDYSRSENYANSRTDLPRPLYGHVQLFAREDNPLTADYLQNSLESTKAGSTVADHLIVIGCYLSDDAVAYLEQQNITHELIN